MVTENQLAAKGATARRGRRKRQQSSTAAGRLASHGARDDAPDHETREVGMAPFDRRYEI